jgi:beta-glucosidase
VTVTNSGERDGDEVVQLYVRDLVASRTRPVKQLRRFARVSLAAGGSTKVAFRLAAADLSLLGDDMVPVVEPGEFEIQIGSSADDIRLRQRFVVE